MPALGAISTTKNPHTYPRYRYRTTNEVALFKRHRAWPIFLKDCPEAFSFISTSDLGKLSRK